MFSAGATCFTMVPVSQRIFNKEITHLKAKEFSCINLSPAHLPPNTGNIQKRGVSAASIDHFNQIVLSEPRIRAPAESSEVHREFLAIVSHVISLDPVWKVESCSCCNRRYKRRHGPEFSNTGGAHFLSN